MYSSQPRREIRISSSVELKSGAVLGEMTWVEIRDAIAAGYGVVLPVGATEQHGPHLPVTTDCLLPLAVALGAARETRMLVATPVYYGCPSKPLSGGGQGFPGTASIRGATMINLIKDLVGEFIRSGFLKIFVLNWHIENRGFVYEGLDLAMADANSSGARVISMDNVFEAVDKKLIEAMFPSDFPGWDVEHASIIETSLMLALYPEHVRVDKIVDDQAERHPPYDMIPAPADTIPSTGVLYKATLGTAEKGLELYRMAVNAVVSAIRTEFEV